MSCSLVVQFVVDRVDAAAGTCGGLVSRPSFLTVEEALGCLFDHAHGVQLLTVRGEQE